MASVVEGNAMFIFNIKKANAEIARLTAENAAQAEQIKELTESAPDALAQAESAVSEANAAVERLSAELAETKASVEKLTKERDEAMAAKEVAITQASVEASKKAAEIVASQGAQAATVDPQSTGNPAEQLSQITDPTERAKFIRANSKSLFTKVQSTLKN